MDSENQCDQVSRVWPWRLLAGLLILATALFRLWFLVHYCTLDLAPDEAHYWDWSRNLDWSYYSKGPLVALLIRGSCWLLGDWSLALTGTLMPAVRFPAVVCGSLLLLALYVLTTLIWRRESLAFAAMALGLTFPLLAAGSMLMTIDSPYTCLWAWALVTAYLALFREAKWAWPATGLLVAVGILAKYTMVLFVPSVGLFLLFQKEYRRYLWRPGFWVMALVGTLGALPILFWNWQNGWVTLQHARGHAGLTQAARGFQWFGPLHYVALQAAILLGFWFFFWAQAMWAYRPWKESDVEKGFLWWLSAPMFLFFLLFSFKNGGGEANWPVTAYLSGLVLTAGWLVQQLADPRPWYRALARSSVAAACGLGLALVIGLHQVDRIRSWLVPLAGPITAERPMPLRRLDPTCRLRGWQTLAGAVDQIMADLRQEGIEPVVAATTWSLPGELGFYCQGRPTVYSVGLAMGDRHSQYDLWRPNPLADADHFKGKTFILVGGWLPSLKEAFDVVGSPQFIMHREEGQPLSGWQVTVARGFRGFANSNLGNRTY